MEFSAADTVFQSLLGDDGYVSLDKFRVFFVNFEKKTGAPSEASAAVPVEANAAAPLEASTAPVALPRSIDDFFIPKTVSAPGSKKKRAVADDDADFVGDDEVESPKQKKGKKQAASGKSSSGLTKAVRTARLKSVMSSLKASVKTKKFYGNFPRPNDCNAELSCSVEEFNELFGHVGELVPNEKKTSKIITRNFTAEDLVTLFGEPSLSVQTYSMPRGFQKQHKMGSAKLKLEGAKCTFSGNLNKAKFVFSCQNRGVGGGFWGSDSSL